MEHKEITPDFISQFTNLVDKANNIAITAHENPDEDSISCVLSVYSILSKKYPQKNIRIVYSSLPDTKYKIFDNYSKIEFVEDIADHLINTDLLIMLDGSNLFRFTKKENILKQIPQTICIDHHSSPIDDFTLSLVVPQYPSCAEVVLHSLCANFEMDKPLAGIFLLGILGDTGNLTYLRADQSSTFTTVQKLLSINPINIQEFQSQYRGISQKIFKAIQELITNTRYSSIPGWPDFQYSFISREYMLANNLTNSEISEASHRYSSEYIGTIEGYKWGFTITPNNNGDANISCRSLPGSVNVRDFVERQEIGGGHNRASGGTFHTTTKALDTTYCIDQTLAWIESNQPIFG